MKKIIKRTLIIFVIMSILMSITPIYAIAQMIDDLNVYHVYVSINGDDINNDGSKNKPFKSIEKAKEYVRTLEKDKDIIVEIADGFYSLNNTLTFEKEDSGTKNCNIRYIAAPNAHPVISGGDKVKSSWTNKGNGIYCTSFERDKKLRALYVNDERRYMTSRTIRAVGSFGNVNIEMGEADWAWVSSKYALENSSSVKMGVKYLKDTIPIDTINQDDIELMSQTRWNTNIVCVEKLEKSGLNINAYFQMPYGAIAQTPAWGNEFQFNKENTVYNVFEWLENKGEFYFDKSEHLLYYIPKDGEDINNIEVVVPRLDTLIEIKGDNLNNKVEYLSFEGLTFAHTDWNLCEVDNSFGRSTNQGATVLYNFDNWQWHDAIYRAYDLGPAAIFMSSCQNIEFLNNLVLHTGNEGVTLANDAVNIKIDGNIIYDTAGCGILVGHPQHMYIGDKDSDFGRDSDREKYSIDEEGVCKDLTITNNLIKNVATLFWGDSAVTVFVAENMLYQYNHIENTPYSGLSLGWGWWNMNGSEDSVVQDHPTTTCKNNKILNNRFIDTIAILADAGAIYTLGDMPGTIISENYIKHIGTDNIKAAYHIRGIHLDEGTKHVYGEKNVIDIDVSFAAIDCGNWGYKGDNTWDNNYSTSDIFKTTDDYEPGTIITNKHISADAKWDKNALSIIDNAGIQKEYKNILTSKYYLGNVESNKNYKGLIIGIVIGSIVLVALVGACAYFVVRKKREKISVS